MFESEDSSFGDVVLAVVLDHGCCVGRLAPKLDHNPWYFLEVATVARNQLRRMCHANSRDAQVVGADANLLVTPLLVLLLGLRGVRQDSDLAECVHRCLEEFVGAFNGELSFACFGLPDRVNPDYSFGFACRLERAVT